MLAGRKGDMNFEMLLMVGQGVGTLKTRKMLRSRSTMMVRNMRLMDMWESSNGLLLADVGE